MAREIRAGLCSGEVELTAGNLHGLAAPAAARVSALAGPNEIFVSAVTRDLLDGSRPTFGSAGSTSSEGLAVRLRS